MVSVVIPVYNRAEKIAEALRSVQNQSYQDWEVIVVDDASTDNTVEVICQFAVKDSRIRLIRHNKNLGAQAARNTGIKAAQGTWIIFLDSDDQLLPHCVETQLEAAREQNVSVVDTDGYQINDDGVLKEWTYHHLRGWVYKDLLAGKGVIFSGLLVEKEALRKINYLDERMPAWQDWETGVRLAKYYRFGFQPRPTFIKDRRPANSIEKDRRKNAEGQLRSFYKHFAATLMYAGPRAIATQYRVAAELHKLAGAEGKARLYSFLAFAWWPLPKIRRTLKTLREFFWLFLVNNLEKYFPQLLRLYRCELKGRRKYYVIKNILLSWEPVLFAHNKRMYREQLNDPFRFVGLMLSRRCEANCIFCPISQKTDSVNKEPYMSMEVFTKIIDELAEHKFSGKINFGENGDALLHPHFKEIIKYAHEKLPLARTVLFTNMMHVDRAASEFLLGNGLSSLTVNIDGASPEVYKRAKPGLNLGAIRKNLHDFIDVRNKLGGDCKINIGILPPSRYLELRMKRKNVHVSYDAGKIIEYWKGYLSERDYIGEFIYLFHWNTRNKTARWRSCPPEGIAEEWFYKLFISTEGSAYICCMDYSTALTYGNALESSVYDLWQSPRRREIIWNIISKRFSEIGHPCIYCNEKYDFARCYLNFIRHRYFSKS